MEILLITGIVLIVMGITIKLIQVLRNKKAGSESTGNAVAGFLGLQLVLGGALLLSAGLMQWLHFYILPALLGGFFIVLIVYSVFQALKLKRESEKYRSKAGFTVSGIVAVIIFSGAMVLYFLSDPAIIMNNNTFEIRGAEGIKVHLDDFKAITIENYIPKIVDMYDGIQLGDTYRGKFELYRTGTSLLYVDQPASPYIFVFLKSNIGLVITRDNPEDTRKLYEEIRNYWTHYLQNDVVKRNKQNYVK